MTHSILNVEDEPLLSRNVGRYLEHQQYEVAQAPTLARGIADYEALRPDVVLVDHSLPDGTGIELIRHIRQRDLDSKIVMITRPWQRRHRRHRDEIGRRRLSDQAGLAGGAGTAGAAAAVAQTRGRVAR